MTLLQDLNELHDALCCEYEEGHPVYDAYRRIEGALVGTIPAVSTDPRCATCGHALRFHLNGQCGIGWSHGPRGTTVHCPVKCGPTTPTDELIDRSSLVAGVWYK